MADGKRTRNSSSESNLYRRPDKPGGQYYSRVKINGKDRRVSLRTSIKADALKKLRRILDNADRERNKTGERHPWKTVVTEWAIHAEGALKPSVLDRYKWSLVKSRPILDPLDIEEIDKRVIGDLVSHRKNEGVTNATIRRDITAVSSVLDFCEGRGWIENNVAHDYKRSTIRERRDPIALPDTKDIDALIPLIPGNFAWAVRYAQYSGARQMEVFSLEQRQLREGLTDLWKTKTDTPRVLVNDKRARGALGGTEKRADSKWVFWHARPNQEPQPYRNVASRFYGFVQRALEKKIIKQAFTFHHLRHWYAVDFLRSGGNIYTLQKHLGHASIKTTEIYLAFLTPAEQERAKHGKEGANGAQ